MKFDRTGFQSLEDRVHRLEEMEVVSKDQIKQLTNMGYFTAPASTCFHGDYEGGLFDHSYAVTQALWEMTISMDLEWTRPQSPTIVGMFHDLCKCDEYTRSRGSWMRSDKCVLRGHGAKSIIRLSQLMTLTEEEILCIRYHMGAYERDDWEEYDRAIRMYPNVLFTHTADMIASKIMGV